MPLLYMPKMRYGAIWANDDIKVRSNLTITLGLRFDHPVQVDFVRRAIGDAERSGTEVLVVQLNSRGGVVSSASIDGLITRIRQARVPLSRRISLGPTWRSRRAASR